MKPFSTYPQDRTLLLTLADAAAHGDDANAIELADLVRAILTDEQVSIDSEEADLRDHFAGKALVSMGTWMPTGFSNLNDGEACRKRAEWAYAQADAMIAARKGGAA